MNFKSFPWISLDFYAFPFVFVDFKWCCKWFLCVSMDFYGLSMISMDFHGFLSTSNDLMSMDFEKCPWISMSHIYINIYYIYMDFYWLVIGGLLQTSLDFKCFLCTSHDLYGARWILNGFPLISLDFYGCLFRSVDFYVLQTVFCVHGGLSWSIFKKSSIHIYWFQMIFCWFLYEFCEGLCVSENFQGFL